jgi:hypothetical protein
MSNEGGISNVTKPPCLTCNGTGWVGRKVCPTCRPAWLSNLNETTGNYEKSKISLKIPLIGGAVLLGLITLKIITSSSDDGGSSTSGWHLAENCTLQSEKPVSTEINCYYESTSYFEDVTIKERLTEQLKALRQQNQYAGDSTVTITFSTKLVDRYGNEYVGKVVSFTWDYAELRKVNWAEIGLVDLGHLAGSSRGYTWQGEKVRISLIQRTG